MADDPLATNGKDEKRATLAGTMDGMTQGWTGTLDQFTEYLASQ
jgi:hypothetical protein